MVSFPHCKINLGLRVLHKRPDGYHDLETVFYPLPLNDVLEIIPSDPAQSNFTASGLPIPGDPASNLCTKAWHLLKKDFPALPAVNGWLHKNIPMGAGLGGGSADGAFMLRQLDSTFQLELGREKLAAYALQLGSDCPFFIYDQPCFATGRGEFLEPIDLDLSAWFIVLVYPGIHIGTALAFSELQTHTESRPTPPAYSLPLSSLKAVIAQPVASWRSSLINDFEAPLCKRYPELQKIKDKLYEAGAVYASMTGSGSAFYGLFPKPQKSPLPNASLFPGYFFRIL